MIPQIFDRITGLQDQAGFELKPLLPIFLILQS